MCFGKAMAPTTSSTEKFLQEFLLDYDNCKDIEERLANSPKEIAWRQLLTGTWHWERLKECSYDDCKLKEYFSSLNDEDRRVFFLFAVECISAFVQQNFTGPRLPQDICDFLDSSLFDDKDFRQLLIVNNEEINVNADFPVLLVAARCVFQNCDFNNLLNLWWCWRCLIIHQKIFDDLSPSLLSQADRLLKEMENLHIDGHSKAKLEIEIAQLYIIFHHASKSPPHIQAACELLGLKYEITGKLGRRTKHQQKDIAQLALELTLIEKEGIDRPAVKEFDIPKNLTLEDQVRLDALKYADNMSQDTLFPNTEQKLLLLVVQEMMISKPRDDLYYEEVQPFLELILSQNNTWTMRAITLLIRCKMESDHKRTIERSMLQCDEVLQHIRKETPHPLNRLGNVYGTGLPPIWKVEAQLGKLMLSLGLVKASLDIFKELQAWEEVILCYNVLKQTHKAAEVIKQQLDINPTVKLWCLLGDATNDVSCYEKAWELSKRRSSRAQCQWGQYHFFRKEYKECIPHFEKSVSINPLHLEVWLYMGFAALEIENWNIAATAYRRYTALEPGNFEAWNNLAKAYIKLNNKHSAHRALLDALKCNYENWKVWDNFMVVSSDIAHFADVIRSYHRILDLKGKHIDPEVLETLVYSVNNNINDAEGNPSGKYMQKTRELLGRLLSMCGSDGNLWTFYAILSPVIALRAQRLQRAYNSFAQGQWDKDITTCVQVLHVCHKLAEIVLSDEVEPTDAIVNSVRLNIGSAVSAIKKHDYEETRSQLLDATNLWKKVLQKQKSALKSENKAKE